ncbi:MAG: hypothetical protein IK085_11160 [Clostridia bacterium]|nr:hypothetical protein [Clostridia bacterium]
MNTKAEKLNAEKESNAGRIENYRNRIASLQESIRKLVARNKEIDSELVDISDESLLALVKEAGYDSPEKFRDLINSLRQKSKPAKHFEDIPGEDFSDSEE